MEQKCIAHHSKPNMDFAKLWLVWCLNMLNKTYLIYDAYYNVVLKKNIYNRSKHWYRNSMDRRALVYAIDGLLTVHRMKLCLISNIHMHIHIYISIYHWPQYSHGGFDPVL